MTIFGKKIQIHNFDHFVPKLNFSPQFDIFNGDTLFIPWEGLLLNWTSVTLPSVLMCTFRIKFWILDLLPFNWQFGSFWPNTYVFDSLTSSSYVMTASYNTDSNFLIPLKKLHSYKISNCVQKFNFQKNEQIFEIEFLCKKLVNFCIKDSFICIRIGIFAPKIISYCVL